MPGILKYLRCSILFLIGLAGCNRSNHSDLQGAWILVASHHDYFRDTVPAGFRFFTSDSVEVYWDPFVMDRFAGYHTTLDRLTIQSGGRSAWTKKIIQTNDSLTVFLQGDTLTYFRALNAALINTGPIPDKMVLSIGSGWGHFVSVVLYPDGKTVFTTSATPAFSIRNSNGLFRRMVDSYATISELMKTEAYRRFTSLEGKICFDGDFSELLLVRGDSTTLSERGSLCSLNSHLLGLPYVGVADATHLPGGWKFTELNSVKFSFDSVRTPYLELFRPSLDFSPAFSEEILFMESLNPANRIAFDSTLPTLPYHFELETTDKMEKIQFYTDGRTVKIAKGGDSSLFKLPYSLLGVITKPKRPPS